MKRRNFIKNSTVASASLLSLNSFTSKNNNIEKTIDSNILKTQERIEKILGLKVNIINKKNNSGKVTIQYKDLDQFELISDLLTKH